MPAERNPTRPSDDADLREIEALVQAVPIVEPEPAPAPAQDAPDLEAVARDLGISVDEVKALRSASLG
jgi:hypothetical protein